MAALDANIDISDRKARTGARASGTSLIGRLGSAAVILFVPALILLLWWVSATRAWVSPQVLPPPIWVFSTFVDLSSSGEIVSAAMISFRRIAQGFLIGATLGFLFGLLIGHSKSAEAYLGPTFRALAAVPSLGWLPILILLLGIEEALKMVILAKACFVPMVICTTEGARNIPRHLSEVAHVLGVSRTTRFFKLVIPAMAPFLASGVRLALSQAFVSLIVVEMLAGTNGLGYMMVWGRTLFQLDIVIVGMLVVGSVGFLIDLLLKRGEAFIRAESGANG
ncbi:ABC transporter permease [Rhizobium sp. SAFR-030]|uniref:ABC transporter permease n=1 Tax=Rhizobium sp. SAFR-030 TaxID=3387277 RepID=UPI003F7FA19A